MGRTHLWHPTACLALLLTGCAGTTPGVPSPTAVETPSGPVPDVVAGECPDPTQTPPTSQAAEFANGASWARVCGTSTAGIGSGIPTDGVFANVLLGPPDALVTGLDDLVEFANGLPRMPGDAACTSEFGPAYTLVVGYPDGSTTMITGELYGCRAIGGDRTGARELLDDFGNRLRAQRDAYPQLAPAASSCLDPEPPFGDAFVQPRLDQTTAAYALAVQTEGILERVVNEITEWPQLRDEIARDSVPQTPATTSGGDSDQNADSSSTSFEVGVSIEAANAQCETLTLQVSQGTVYWSEPGGESMVWQPSASAIEALQPYLDWATTGATPR
ncbi:hypothetical protein GCM10009785_03230 [Brooklawnia cerclae]|uniref:Uncharacterized protein n=1 Tax=Brooklawnia cerclae TaxID=349934 RepID=A0ABX0SCG4_9ACTN|nr:hypothetical protein [Brooklawnia cerclae]NIH56083.1 hypothetical protein [Brooklawnia cerclae]